MQILFNQLKNYKISILLILVLTYISTISELMIPLLLANALNVGIIQNYGILYIKNIAFTMTIFISISIILNTIISYLINRVSILCSSNIKNNLFSKILTMKIDEKNRITNASLLTRTTHDIDQIKGFISSLLGIIFKAPILFINCITVLGTLNKNFSTTIIISIISLIIYLIIVIILLLPLSKQMQLKIDKLNTIIKEKIKGIKIIKSYNKLKEQDNKFNKANEDYLKTAKKVIKISSFINPILNLLINITTIIVLVISINLVKQNLLDVGTIVATIQYILQILLSIIMISMIALLIPKTSASLIRIKEIMTSASYIQKEEKINLDLNSISFENVNLKLNNNLVLNNVNFTINKNDKIGIIGPTGSGKSTLIKLLLKDYETVKGNIKIDNFSIDEISRKDITKNIAYLPQSPYILTGTILENIAFANQKTTQEEIAKIVYTTNLAPFIANKSEKLNYRLEQNGANLSGGQKQRIALARVLATNSKCLILDEPFSSLDYKNEREIINNLNNFYSDKTIIIISKRISSLMHCNKIIYLDKGQIIAIGTHENLLKTCPKYKEMYELQKEVLEYDI